jgi:hypothetical protein
MPPHLRDQRMRGNGDVDHVGPTFRAGGWLAFDGGRRAHANNGLLIGIDIAHADKRMLIGINMR